MTETMLPTRPDPATRAAYVDRILAAWGATTREQRDAGRYWYPQAHDLAAWLASGDARTGAGVLAALSPNNRWGRNIDLAVRAFAEGRACGTFGDAVTKANRILAGEDPSRVLPAGRKTWHFWAAIAGPDDPSPVVVDRHAHDIAAGRRFGDDPRGLDTVRRYDSIADAYRTAGEVLGEIPSAVQAATWLAWRDGLPSRRGLSG